MSDNATLNNVLSVLDTINKENTFSFFVPSLQREVKFKGITTGQQKSLLKASVDNPVFQTRFVMATYGIITENCSEKEVVTVLTTIDSLAILIQYRVAIYGKEYVHEPDKVSYKVDLSTISEKLSSVNIPGPAKFTEDKFTVVVGPPTLVEQYQLEKQIRSNNNADATLNDTIGEAFIGEVSKFIKEICVTVDGKEQLLNYKDLSFVQKHLVLEKLPTTVVRNIVGYMESVAAEQTKVTRFTGVFGEGDAAIKKELDITVDSSLFAIS